LVGLAASFGRAKRDEYTPLRVLDASQAGDVYALKAPIVAKDSQASARTRIPESQRSINSSTGHEATVPIHRNAINHAGVTAEHYKRLSSSYIPEAHGPVDIRYSPPGHRRR
jgi:hypothetical protein